jgi:8-oxo-dGTP pyrophosphatase MutT (NUDIX family)
LSDPEAAAREAKQEAGATGKISGVPIGNYRYRKTTGVEIRFIDVVVYVLWVKKQHKRWREKDERTRTWFSQKEAAQKVREPRLKILIASLRA